MKSELLMYDVSALFYLQFAHGQQNFFRCTLLIKKTDPSNSSNYRGTRFFYCKQAHATKKSVRQKYIIFNTNYFTLTKIVVHYIVVWCIVKESHS
jgi:hypothetical protein